ncbi:cytochrome P450 [Poronia punctata]|nr:cytochrome P450 [Poronia punctata]
MFESNPSLWTALFGGWVFYLIYGAFWRLYLSPISHVPGPRLAALTQLYEMYYDTWLGGKYEFKIMELHEKYGPIIRITPWELHISDPDFYDTIYPGASSTRRTEKYWNLVRYFGLDLCLFSTIDHDLHKLRRGALSSLFGMNVVRSLQPVIQERVDAVMRRLAEYREKEKVVNANNMFAALTNDIVETYCFARCHHRIEHPDFDPQSREASFKGATSVHIMKHVWWVYTVISYLPISLVKALHTGAGLYMEQKKESREEVQKIVDGENEDWRGQKQPTIFRTVLDAKLPAHERSVDRMADDAQMTIMAGTLTTAMTSETMLFWLLAQPDTLRKLKEELQTVMPANGKIGSVPLATLESLPYLTGVVKEGLRLSYGASMRLQRIDPDNPIIFTDQDTGKKWTIPAKTVVSMSALQIHHNESIFPDSKVFRPERWLGAEGRRIDKYLVSFSKGTRNCLGMNLALGELYLFLANMWTLWTTPEVGPVGGEAGVLELYKTTKADIEITGDYYIPMAAPGSVGIRMTARYLD